MGREWRIVYIYEQVCITCDGGIYMKVLVFLDFVVDSQYTSLLVNFCQSLCYSITEANETKNVNRPPLWRPWPIDVLSRVASERRRLKVDIGYIDRMNVCR